MNYGKGYRDCIKRNGDKTRMESTCYIVTSCHRNDDEMWSTSCLIMQHKPYIVEQPSPHSFKSYYHYTKVRKYACLHFQCLGSDIQVAYFNRHNAISQSKCKRQVQYMYVDVTASIGKRMVKCAGILFRVGV